MVRFGVFGDKTFLSAATGGQVEWCDPFGRLDALLLMPGDPDLHHQPVSLAVAPADRHVPAKQLITYGLGERETVTLSSMSRDGFVMALQREIVTLSGLRLERQEILLPYSDKPMKTLALAAALLAADCPQDQLGRRMEFGPLSGNCWTLPGSKTP